MAHTTKLKRPRTCEGCSAFMPRMNGHPPECWLGEKIEERNPFSFDGSYSVRPEKGECYKPRTNMELMHMRDVLYTRKENKK